MNGYLLDTHTAIWFFTGDSLLSPVAGQIILDDTNQIYLSVISAWELTIKISLGKLRFPGDAVGFMEAAADNDITILPIEMPYFTVLKGLPFIHRDPFDRLLVATAIVEGFTLITTDGNIAQYKVSNVW
jgi:PIN domain nuclease of toxin-antitoxin system